MRNPRHIYIVELLHKRIRQKDMLSCSKLITEGSVMNWQGVSKELSEEYKELIETVNRLNQI